MAKFQFQELVDSLADNVTARLGAGTGTVNNLTDKEVGKAVKLVSESRYDLAVLGNDIEGFITSIEGGTSDGYTIGTVRKNLRKWVLYDGLQATGLSNATIGDIVVCGTAVAKDTALTDAAPQKVRTATTAANVVHKWRVVSFGTAGSGAPGSLVLIERI